MLIVEDNLDAAEMLEVAVSQSRPRHQAGSRWRERNLDGASEFAPDVIFLDIGLPVMNGYAVARSVARNAGVQCTSISPP